MHCKHNEPKCNAGHWALELETISFSDSIAFYYEVFCHLAKLIQMKSATLQRFQLAFKHLLLLEKNSRLHPIFQDFALNVHTFSRSGKIVRKFPDFFKNSRLCTNPVYHKSKILLTIALHFRTNIKYSQYVSWTLSVQIRWTILTARHFNSFFENTTSSQIKTLGILWYEQPWKILLLQIHNNF